MRRLIIFALAVLPFAGIWAAQASASQKIDDNATGVRLAVSDEKVALVTYRARGALVHVLARGAINARPPKRGVPQAQFQLDSSGGVKFYGKPVWQTFKNTSQAYDGPPLKWFKAGCKASDGTYWAIQAWQRRLANYGVRPTPHQAVWELRLSHWRGALPILDIKLDWTYRRYHHLYGRYTYLGKPVFGFRSTSRGETLDPYGRNIYVDTFKSRYGRGWRRENSFLTHRGTGVFCYAFFPHSGRPTGMGQAYRATVIGPGVTPDSYWEAKSPGPFNAEKDLLANLEQQRPPYRDRLCKPN